MTAFDRADEIDEVVDLMTHLKEWDRGRLEILHSFLQTELKKRYPARGLGQEDVIWEAYESGRG